MSDAHLKGRTAIVTGGASGLDDKDLKIEIDAIAVLPD